MQAVPEGGYGKAEDSNPDILYTENVGKLPEDSRSGFFPHRSRIAETVPSDNLLGSQLDSAI